MSLIRPRAAVLHPRLAYGGSETGAMWTLQALKHDYELTLVSGGPVDLERLNNYYGTDLRRGEFRIHEVRMPPGLGRTVKFAGLRDALFTRECRRLVPSFDVITSHYNPIDLGVPLIQFVADFSFAPRLQQRLDPSTTRHWRWWYGDSILRRTYLNLCDHLAPHRPENWKQNITVANSRWTAGLLERNFGIIADRVQFPPVPGSFPAVPWNLREDGFVCVGRVVPEKRLDEVIRILEQVRRRNFNVHLHILGQLDGSPCAMQIRHLASRHSDWVHAEGLVTGRAKRELMARHKFGINGCRREAFGIAVAELVKAGCITFVPNGGGQTEIVGHPMLTFTDEDDAVARIQTVLSSLALQEDLRRHLAGQAKDLSVREFMGTVRQLVAEFLKAKEGAGGIPCCTRNDILCQAA
jgi:glycosyltransferase involved in cell wall biosynthesis